MVPPFHRRYPGHHAEQGTRRRVSMFAPRAPGRQTYALPEARFCIHFDGSLCLARCKRQDCSAAYLGERIDRKLDGTLGRDRTCDSKQMLSLKPRFFGAFPGNGVLERLRRLVRRLSAIQRPKTKLRLDSRLIVPSSRPTSICVASGASRVPPEAFVGGRAAWGGGPSSDCCVPVGGSDERPHRHHRPGSLVSPSAGAGISRRSRRSPRYLPLASSIFRATRTTARHAR